MARMEAAEILSPLRYESAKAMKPTDGPDYGLQNYLCEEGYCYANDGGYEDEDDSKILDILGMDISYQVKTKF